MLGERVLLGGVDHAHSDLSVLAQVSNAQMAVVRTRPPTARPRPRAVCEARVTSPLWAALVRARCAVRCASRVLRSWIMPPTSKRPVRGHAHAATDHARQRATMQRAIINGQRRRRQAGRSKSRKGLEGTGKEMLTSTGGGGEIAAQHRSNGQLCCYMYGTWPATAVLKGEPQPELILQDRGNSPRGPSKFEF